MERYNFGCGANLTNPSKYKERVMFFDGSDKFVLSGYVFYKTLKIVYIKKLRVMKHLRILTYLTDHSDPNAIYNSKYIYQSCSHLSLCEHYTVSYYTITMCLVVSRAHGKSF